MSADRTYRQMRREIERADEEIARLEAVLKQERRRPSIAIRPRPDPTWIQAWAAMNREIREVAVSAACFALAVGFGALTAAAAPWVAGAYGFVGSLVLTHAIIGRRRRADQTKED
jgi:Flp pilus assembly protein TadB